ncbi:hypothetical protein [Fontivita pretiosa]|uniref:hypothetical protein n=1 Tax=Fontivita pretiosa TaxID=2989684 RepID=UPI003D16FC60
MTRILRRSGLTLAVSLLVLAPSCARVSVDPIEVKPIHVVVDVNVRIDRELDEFFAFEDKYRQPATQPTTTQTASASDSAGK